MASSRAYFAGRSVVVTGGSSGIGLAFAQRIAELGAIPVLVARRASVLDEARKQIESRLPSARVHTIALDVANEVDVERVMREHLERFPVDMLVNNAGVVMPGRFVELPTREFRQMMDVNYFGTVHMTKALAPHFIARRAGHVLNVSSLAGVLGIYGYTAYAASKFALVGFSQALRAELWPSEVRVSLCLPPDTDTPQLAFENQHKPAETKAIAGTVKTLRPEQVADAMVEGMAQGKFEIYPDAASRLVALGQGVLPGITRLVCDSAQRKASPS
jgi:3-dehydrosphinganine reductase